MYEILEQLITNIHFSFHSFEGSCALVERRCDLTLNSRANIFKKCRADSKENWY